MDNNKKTINLSENFIKFNNNTEKKEYHELMQYISKYAINKEDTINYDNKNNIIDIKKCAYDIPDEHIPMFMLYLNNCRKNGINLHFIEKQQKYSGIMYDFDVLTDNDDNIIDILPLDNIVKNIMSIIKKYINLQLNDLVVDIHGSPDENNTKYKKFNVFMIKKPYVIFDEKKEKYKNGFHLLIPEIKISKESKKFIFSKLLKCTDLQNIFKMNKLNLSEILDKGSVYVPTYFLGSSKFESTPYELFKHWEFSLTSNDIFYPKQIIINDNHNINWCYELSLNYQNSNSVLLQKNIYYTYNEFKDEIRLFNEFRDDNVYFDNELNDIENQIKLLIIKYPDVQFIYDLLKLISLDRIRDYNNWINIIFILSNENPEYKPLAIWVSKRTPEKWNKRMFDKIWNTAIESGKYKENKLSIGSLIRWVRIDNEVEYNNIAKGLIKTKIRTDIFCNKLLEGDLQDAQYATYIHSYFKDKFISEQIEKNNQWYEFITPSDKHNKGEVYKWRVCEDIPNLIIIILNNAIPEYCKEILKEIKNYLISLDDDDNEVLKKTIAMLIRNFQSSAKKLYTNATKKKIIKEANVLFDEIKFGETLDQDPYLLGVGNGIIKFEDDGGYKLITGYHNYRISKFTKIDFINNEEIEQYEKMFYKFVSNMFHKEKKDALEFLLYFFAKTLDGTQKEALFPIFLGSGSNGKSMLLDFILEVFGPKYATDLPLAFFVDKRSSSTGADPMLMELEGKRLAYYSESGPNEQLNIERMKLLSGDANVKGRGLYKDPKSFTPVASHIILTNHYLGVDTSDHGTWRRILLIRAEIEFYLESDKKYDPTNKNHRVINEQETNEFKKEPRMKIGALSYLVKLRKKLQSKYNGKLGKIKKPSIDIWTSEYRNREDLLNRFLEEHILESDDNEVHIENLIRVYREWLKDIIGNEPDISQNTLIDNFKNSRLSKYIEQNNLSKYKIKGIDILPLGEDLPKNQKRLFSNAYN